MYERYQEAMREQWPLRFESYFEPPTPRAMYLSNALGADEDRRADVAGLARQPMLATRSADGS